MGDLMNKNIFVMLLILSILLVGCSESQQATPPMRQQAQNPQAQSPAQSNAIVQTIDISDFAFTPGVITIKKGDTITWINQDAASHTITSDDGSELDSSSLPQGGSYSHTFNTAGEYSYHCKIHPPMKGKVIVE